jgi:hypothetical protein
MMLSPGRHAARTPGASVAFTPSTTHGGHPRSRGAPVATTMASSVRCSRVNLLIAVGTLIAERPPHRTERAQFGHSAPTLGV